MKLQFYISVFFLLSRLSFASAQVIETIKPPMNSGYRMFINNDKTRIQNPKPAVLVDPKLIATQKKWGVTLSQHGIDHGSDVPKAQMDSIKRSGSFLKKNYEFLLPNDLEENQSGSRNTINTYVNNEFKGNAFNGWQPTDNNIAVSDDGYVVSTINSSLFCTDVSGNILLEESFDDFLAVLELTGTYFDPKVLYDPTTDKFIMVVLNGNTPGNSNIVIAFSATSNPKDSWWIYTFPGDPTNENLWLDYPSIGVSTDDIYVSGSQYTIDRIFSRTVIYQLEKGPGFTGGNVTGTQHNDVRDAYGFADFTVTPIPFGFDGSIGPGMYFVSTDGTGGTEAMVYYTDNNSQNNPNLVVYRTTIPNYYAPFDGTMLGSPDKLNANDCRTLTGFYADGTIHFAFNTRGDDFHTKIYYCRLNATDLSSTSVKIGQQPYDCAYPAIAPFTTSTTDKTVLIGFLRSGSAIYPEMRMITCDHDMNPGTSVMVKAGKSFVEANGGDLERWGDYSGISRRHSVNHPEVWIAGGYGESNDNGNLNKLCTWIAQITDGQVEAGPVASFTGFPTNIILGQIVAFSDHSTNNPTSWSWVFEGGTPSTSNQQNPTVKYNTAGAYNVTLTAANLNGNDVETKTGYIIVSQDLQAPLAEFTSDVTNITTGSTVHFEDLSSNTPIHWQWFFPGGTPEQSEEQNPTVVYTQSGCFEVALVAANAAGSDAINKTCYIDVLTGVDDPDDAFNKFVVFPNPVSFGRLNVEFEIAHATELDFLVMDERGAIIKTLMHRRVKEGENTLSFNTEPLIPGAYYLVVHDHQNMILKTVKFIVG